MSYKYKMKVLILNQHANNFGDEAAGTAVVKNLLKNEKVEKIELLYCMPKSLPINDDRVIHNHDIDVRTLTKKEFYLYLLFRKKTGKFIPAFIDKLKEYDKILISPCGANLGVYKDWGLLFQDIIVVMQGRTPIFHLNTISKSGSAFFDIMVQYLCKRSIVYVREKASYDYLTEKGIKAKLGTDSVFSLETLDNVERHKDRIVFVPSDVWDWHVNFKGESRDVFYKYILTPMLEFATEKKLEIIILPHLNSEREKQFHENIIKFAKNNYPEIRIQRENVNEYYDYENCIKSASFVVGMRYHAIVFSVKNTIPFLTLSYEQKMKEVSNYSGQIANCIDIHSINSVSDVRKKLDEIYANQEQIQEEIRRKLDSVIKKSLIVIKENFYD